VDCHELTLDDLQETARSAVRDGIISGNGLQGARATVARLRADEMLPPCPVAPPPAPNPPAAGTPAGNLPGAPVDEHGAAPNPGNPATGQARTPTPMPARRRFRRPPRSLRCHLSRARPAVR